MNNETLRYYEAEMRYLREAGKEFALAYPDRASMLNLDRVDARDPYVERLFEGFAFLMGRLREKLDDDLPELTEGLMSLIWPHYLRTIPSMSIVQFEPNYKEIKHSEFLAKGFEVETDPIGTTKTQCIYRTTRDIIIHPIELSSAKVDVEVDGHSKLVFTFRCCEDVDWTSVDLSLFPLFLDADKPISSSLHAWLTRKVKHCYIAVHKKGAFEPSERRRMALKFKPLGFNENDSLWPKTSTSFSGYQLLLEYFTCREKFMFVNLDGLNQLKLDDSIDHFSIEVIFDKQWPSDYPIKVENFKLNACPVINLFSIEYDPMSLSPFEHEHLLRPLRLQDGHTEIYSVDRVISIKRDKKFEYVPFTSFKHRGGMLRHDAPERYYHTRMKLGVTGMYDTWLVLGGSGYETDRMSKEETLSLQITCTNGRLPKKGLQSASLCKSYNKMPVEFTIKNLIAPTLPCYPPAKDRFHWRLLSHLGANFLSIMDNAEVLRGTLALYDWTDDELNKRRLESIIDVKHKLVQRFEKGFLKRGVSITITIEANGFSGEGDILLFGELLNKFFNAYADVHLFNQLTFILMPTGTQYKWNENHSDNIPG